MLPRLRCRGIRRLVHCSIGPGLPIHLDVRAGGDLHEQIYRDPAAIVTRILRPDTWIGESLGGTDRVTGVTGDLFFAGRRVGTVFLVEVSGQLCRPES